MSKNKKEKDKPPNSWFDKTISDKLNIMQSDNSNIKQQNNFTRIKNSVHFGNAEHNCLHTQTFEFNSKCTHHFHIDPIKYADYDKEKQYLVDELNKLIDVIKSKKLPEKETKTKITIATTKTNKKINNIGKVITAKKYYIKPNIEQIKILNKWFGECTKVYNYCVDKYKENNQLFSKSYMEIKKIIFNDLYKGEDKDCPYDALTDEVKTFCANLKSAKTNLGNGHINNFEMKYKNTSKSQCIFIPSTAVTNGTFYKTHLGKSMIGLKYLEGAECDCRLFYDKLYKKYILIVPGYVKIEPIKDRHPIVALDPGEKVFIAYHGLNTFGLIGNDIRKKILEQEKKIKKWQRILKKKINKKGRRISKQNLRRVQIKLNDSYRKIKNIVKELHNKTALYLCRNYDKILIPEFKTQNMLRGNRKAQISKIYETKGEEEGKKELRIYERTKRLNRRVKFVLNSLSHYKFRQHLANKSSEYGCELKVVTEEYTSVTCTKCGSMSNNCVNRIKRCESCGYKINRDINGARNILIKNIEKELKGR